jgi:hypothetical protein
MSELTTFHEAIADTFRAAMPRVVQVEAFPELDAKVRVPALLFGLTDITPGVDRGTGKTALVGRFQSCVLIDATRPKASLQASILAAQMATVLKDQWWGLDFVTGPAENVHAQPEAPTLELEQFTMWSVQWTQNFEVGELEWPWPEEAPGALLFGFNDDVKDDFVQAEDFDLDKRT